jgi:lincosamide nucleotidyltransferase B/F
LENLLATDLKQTKLPQTELINAVRRICQQDNRLVAALMYGSYTRGEGDDCSDIEFVLYFQDDALPNVNKLGWITQAAPVELLVEDGFGNTVAIFDQLVRGEFHFEPASKMAEVRTWKLDTWAPSVDAMRVLDRTGELSGHLACLVGPPPQRANPEYLLELSGRFFNTLLFGTNVLRRGERARALDHLNHLHRILQWLVRLVENQMDHFPSPAKSFEADISPAAYRRFEQCVATLAPGSLEKAYHCAWQWGKELLATLSEQHHLALPFTLISKIDQRMTDWFADHQGEGDS